MHVGILGGGRWGQALARLAKAAGNEPLIAYRDKKDKPPHVLASTRDAEQVSATCELLVAAVSTSELRTAVRLASPGPRNRVVVAMRGLEPGTGLALTQVVQEESPVLRVGALAGPAPVDEILNGGLCAGVIASPFADVRQLLVAALHSPRYRVYLSSDLAGVQLAQALVPVLASLLGLASGLRGAGAGLHALVLTRGIEEGTRLARSIGAQEATLYGLAGLGDLVSVHAREGAAAFESGRKLAAGDQSTGPRRVAEALLALAGRRGVDLPLTQALAAVYAGADPLDEVGQLMAREAAEEHG